MDLPSSQPQEPQFRVLAESSEDFVFTMDRSHRIGYVNAAAARLLGGSPEEFVGASLNEILPLGGREGPEATLEKVLASGRTLYAERAFAFQDRTVWLNTRLVPVRGDGGSIDMVLGISRDVTSRVEAEQRVRRAEEEYRGTMDSLDVSLHVIDERFRIVLANRRLREWLGGLGIEDVTGRDLFETFPFLSDAVRREYERVFATAQPLATEEGTEIGGRTVHTETRKIPVVSEGRVKRVVTVLRDVTDRVEQEEQFRRVQKMESLGVLAGGIAHEFNNQLMVVLGNVDLARLELHGAPSLEGCLDHIEKAGRSMADLSQQMLSYAGRRPIETQFVQLSRLIDGMRNLLAVTASPRVRIRYELAEDLPAVRADDGQLRQVVLNLVANAAEALEDGEGEIRVATALCRADAASLAGNYPGDDLPEGDYVRLEVRDTGRGIRADARARLFDPFYTTKFTGRGLGLAAVLGIVRSHGGTIFVESEPGEGTAFRILLPAAGAARPDTEAPAPAPARQSDITVLVVDDEEGVRRILSTFLRRRGYGVLEASDGLEALDVYDQRADDISAVVLDLLMPRLDGLETCRELRRRAPDLPVLLASGYDEREARRRFEGVHLSGFLAKPFTDLQQLVADFRGEIAVFGEWLKNFDTCSKSIAKCSATSASIISPKWLTLE